VKGREGKVRVEIYAGDVGSDGRDGTEGVEKGRNGMDRLLEGTG